MLFDRSEHFQTKRENAPRPFSSDSKNAVSICTRVAHGKGLARAAVFSLAAMAATIMLSSCQIRPLYSGIEGSTLNAKMHELYFSVPTTNAAQHVRNELIFMTGGGQGESLNPKYDVSLSANSATSEVLVNDSSDTASAGRTIVIADFSLRRRSDNKLLASGQRKAFALVDFPPQEFAKLRAIRDAEQRASRAVANIINADIAIALNKEPPEVLPPTITMTNE